jgi:CheY-like chemotaxis protein
MWMSGVQDRTRAPGSTPSVAANEGRLASTARGAILIVEDDDGLRTSLAGALEDEGFVVAGASNGREALEYLKAHEPPCLILLDLWMPVMSGEEFRAAQQLDSRWAAVPVVVLSAVGDAADRARALGASGCLTKPLSLDDVLSVVVRYC